MNAIEGTVYLKGNFFEDWPILLYGTYANNLDAERSVLFPGVGEEDNAWIVGFEVGDKEKWVKLGVLYAHQEANAFPAFFTDSDLFDGRTNRKGFTVYGSRALGKGVDLNLTLFDSGIQCAKDLYERTGIGPKDIHLALSTKNSKNGGRVPDRPPACRMNIGNQGK